MLCCLLNSLEVFIEARDSSLTNQRVGSTRLRINIDDVNDNPPNIEIGFIFTDKDNTGKIQLLHVSIHEYCRLF